MTKNYESNGWFRNSGIPWWGFLAKHFLQYFKMPKHIAFVMDGNRRYARRHNFDSVVEGHSLGFDQMTKVLGWCKDLGIIEVTVYAFSIENFKRDKDEVKGLMKLAETKFEKLLNEKQKLIEEEIRFQFFGEVTMLPLKIQNLIAKIEDFTRNFTKRFINVCLAYSSQNEIARAIEWIRQGVQLKLIHENDINSKLISNCLDTRHSLPIDILIRTSGERRLSDFLLWQCSNSYIYFEDVLWPEMNFWHLFKAIACYQKSRNFALKLENALNKQINEDESTNLVDIIERRKNFLNWMNNEQIKFRQAQLA